MINKIHIENIATIQDLTMQPYQINYIFGGNGSGKTTISSFLADTNNYCNGKIEKDDDSEVLVYNKAFVDKNFQDKNAIKGIFTIGESAVEAIKFIEEKEKQRKFIVKNIENYDKSLENIQKEIAD